MSFPLAIPQPAHAADHPEVNSDLPLVAYLMATGIEAAGCAAVDQRVREEARLEMSYILENVSRDHALPHPAHPPVPLQWTLDRPNIITAVARPPSFCSLSAGAPSTVTPMPAAVQASAKEAAAPGSSATRASSTGGSSTRSSEPGASPGVSGLDPEARLAAHSKRLPSPRPEPEHVGEYRRQLQAIPHAAVDKWWEGKWAKPRSDAPGATVVADAAAKPAAIESSRPSLSPVQEAMVAGTYTVSFHFNPSPATRSTHRRSTPIPVLSPAQIRALAALPRPPSSRCQRDPTADDVSRWGLTNGASASFGASPTPSEVLNPYTVPGGLPMPNATRVRAMSAAAGYWRYALSFNMPRFSSLTALTDLPARAARYARAALAPAFGAPRPAPAHT